jgi:hypothetical protein
MTSHHLLNEDELLEKCIYCGRKAEASHWRTEFHLRKHYKAMRCSCGRVQKVKAPMQSSGHDEWVSRKIRDDNLETKVISNDKQRTN